MPTSRFKIIQTLSVKAKMSARADWLGPFFYEFCAQIITIITLTERGKVKQFPGSSNPAKLFNY